MTEYADLDKSISEDWLRSAGFKWHQIDRQPSKHWVLWLSQCFDCGQPRRLASADDVGIEVAANAPVDGEGTVFWFCWLRSDLGGRYSRFIHVRHLRTRLEIIRLVEGVMCRAWKPSNHLYGVLRCDTCAQQVRAEDERLDRVAMRSRPAWYEAEKDDSRGAALPEHVEEALKRGGAC